MAVHAYQCSSARCEPSSQYSLGTCRLTCHSSLMGDATLVITMRSVYIQQIHFSKAYTVRDQAACEAATRLRHHSCSRPLLDCSPL
jgi:hypothetical protein